MRRRLGGPDALVPAGDASLGGDLIRLEHVVRLRFPVRTARVYLRRHLGQDVRVRLVEAGRGERPGTVRAVEVRHAGGAGTTMVRAERRLPNGELAGAFAPDSRVSTVAVADGPAARTRVLSRGDVIVLHVPVQGWTRFLPAVFRNDGPVEVRTIERADTAFHRAGGAADSGHVVSGPSDDQDALSRLMFIFQHLATTVTERIDLLPELTDPLRCDPSVLPWLASWVGFDLDGSLPLDQQRELVRRAIRLYRTRGTRVGIEDMVAVLTAAPVRVKELAAPMPMVLGRSTLAGGANAGERWKAGEGAASWSYDPALRKRTAFFEVLLESREAFRERFGERAADVLLRIIDVTSRERPAHVRFTLRFDESA